jgi:hypothetical protein
MSVSGISAAELQGLQQKLETLTKSVAAGVHGLEAAGRTGIAALAIDSVDSVLRSIAIESEDFLLTKDIPTIDLKSMTYQYRLKTAIGQQGLMDLWGTEASLPQEDYAQYMRVAEVAKIAGMKTSITTLAQLTNDRGAYDLDLEKEQEKTATLNLGQNLERALYHGGDFFMDASGAIDYNTANSQSQMIREMRGVQANVREGNKSSRGIPGDFVGYGNNRSVVFNRKGGVIERGFLDKVATAVLDNGGAISEGHCTSSMLQAFRATFFPIERAMLNEKYQLRGPAVTNDTSRGFSVDTVAGPVTFIPNRFKYLNNIPQMVTSSAGAAPATPSVATALTGSAVNSGFAAGQQFYYRVQACGITGRSAASASALVTVTTANYGVELTITNVAKAEFYMVFRTDAAGAEAGKEMFIGKIATAAAGTTVFRDAGRMIPGLNSVLFMPRDKNRVKVGKLANLVNKLELGRQGMALETLYFSVTACIVDAPRAFAVVDNVYESRNILEEDAD